MEIRRAGREDVREVAELGLRLWPHHDPEKMEKDIEELLPSGRDAFFVAFREEELLGFAQVSLRDCYVEGTHTSPVGYLEGIYVKEDMRRLEIGTRLVEACEEWARDLGCTEFASDCHLDNEESILFHRALGFGEEKIMCFFRPLD